MTTEETKKLLMTINALFPSWKVENPQETVMAWSWALKDYSAEAIMGALEIYSKTDKTGFAPSVSQLVNSMNAPKQHDRLTEGEAWALVKKAIQDGNYHSEEHFDNFPQLVKRAVGSPSMIRQWAMCETNEVNTVIMSNFQRTYKAILSKAEYEDKVPEHLGNLVKSLSDKVSGQTVKELSTNDT